MHSVLAAMDKTMPAKTSIRRFTRATSIAEMTAPSDKPPRSAHQTLPTCSAVKPNISTAAVLSTGTLTITVYPTSAMNRENEIERQPSNMIGVPSMEMASSVMASSDIIFLMCLIGFFDVFVDYNRR
jgi:hypothetical protein